MRLQRAAFLLLALPVAGVLEAQSPRQLTDEDYEHMRKVVGYVHRHMAQGGPANDKRHSRWRYSLMNWGHDPLKRK